MIRAAGPVPYEELPLGALDGQRIEALWRYRAVTPRRQLVLPDGRMDLVVHGRLDARDRLVAVQLALAGPADRPGLVAARVDTAIFGVRFRIGWGGACLGVRPEALRNAVLVGREVEQLLGASAQPLWRARTLEALQAALVQAVAAMTARAPCTAGHGPALRAIEALQQRAPGGPGSGAVAGQARTLRRHVVAVAGLPLRTLAGILRFQRAMAMLNAGAWPTLGELALEAGYADQAHMTRAFRRFGGFTPALPSAAPVVGAGFQGSGWPQASRRGRFGAPHSLISTGSEHAHPTPVCGAAMR